MGTSDRRAPSWQWVAVTTLSILLTVVGSVAAYSYIDIHKKIEGKADQKAVDIMREDLRDIREMMNSHIIATGAGKPSKRDRGEADK
jgi:hypothetical protein